MADEPTIYDLMLLLSGDAPEDQRSRVLSTVESAVASAGGSIERNDDWGRRPMAYEIRHRPEAEYHLLQFRAPASVIEELSHTLRITDGVLRFRIIKVRPGTPPVKPGAPPVVSAVASATSSGAGQDGGSAPAPTAPPEPAPPEGPSDTAAVTAEDAPAADE